MATPGEENPPPPVFEDHLPLQLTQKYMDWVSWKTDKLSNKEGKAGFSVI